MNAGDSSISYVAVKPPPFWRSSPQFWFDRLEAQFELARISDQRTKFNYVLSVLDGEVIQVVSDIIRSPHVSEPYDNLKTNLIKRLSISETAKLSQLLGDLSLGDRQPSQFLREMRELGGDKVSEELLRSLWLQRLPDNMQAILACNPGNLTELANCADKIAEVYNKPNVYLCDSTNEANQSSLILERLETLTNELNELKQKFYQQKYKGRSRSRSRSKSINENNNAEKVNFCWYHARFADKATKCIKPCTYITKPKN